MTTYYLLRAGSAISRVVPLAVLYALAGLAARLVALLPTAGRAAARANIARVLGQAPESLAVRRGAARAMRYQALNYVDMVRIDRVSEPECDATVVRGDLSPLFDCLAEGKGAIIVSAHLGNMDYVVQWLGLHGIPVHSLMERLEPERLNRLVVSQRKGAGLYIDPIGPQALPRLTRLLREGKLVALLCDRDIGGTGEPVCFFGREARLPVGPVLLALRTGAPLVPSFGRRLRDNRLYVTVKPPIYLQRTRDLRADLREGLRALARALEDGIADAPDQWIVFAPIWPDADAVQRAPAPAPDVSTESSKDGAA